MSLLPLYPTNATNCSKPQPIIQRPQTQQMPIQVGCAPKPYNLELDFSRVDLLRNLTGSIFIDPCCPGNYALDIKGQVDGFSNLSNFITNSSTTLNLISSVTNLSNGLKEIILTGNAPLKVNNVVASIPATPGGFNFRNPVSTEVATGFLPVAVTNGVGSTSGDIFFTVDVSSITTPVNSIKYESRNYDNIVTPVNVPITNALKLVSASDAISVVGSDVGDSVTFGLRIDNATTYNELSVNGAGLLSYHLPYFADSSNNTNITWLDGDSGAQALPIGAVGIWKNTLTPGGASGAIIRKVNNAGSNQWQAVSTVNNAVTVGDSSTVDLSLIGNNITAAVPLRITTNGVTVTTPIGTTSVGYQLQSQGNSVNITNPTAGVVNFEVGNVVSVSPTSTANVTNSGNNVSVVVPMRINNATVTQPSGATPLGYNYTSSGGTLIWTNPTSGVVNAEVNFISASTSTAQTIVSGNTVSVLIPLRINGAAASQPAGSSSVGYNITSTTLSITQPNNGELAINSRNGYTSLNTDSSVSGSTSATSTGNDLIKVAPSGNLTANRTRNLLNAGATTGNIVTFQTFGLTAINLAGFEYRVSADTGSVLSGTPLSLQPNTFYEFAFNGAGWERTK